MEVSNLTRPSQIEQVDSADIAEAVETVSEALHLISNDLQGPRTLGYQIRSSLTWEAEDEFGIIGIAATEGIALRELRQIPLKGNFPGNRSPEWGRKAGHSALLWLIDEYIDSWAVDKAVGWLKYLKDSGFGISQIEAASHCKYGGLHLRKLAERLNSAERSYDAHLVIDLAEASDHSGGGPNRGTRGNFVIGEGLADQLRTGKSAPRRFMKAKQILHASRLGIISESKRESLLSKDRYSLEELQESITEARALLEDEEDDVSDVPAFSSYYPSHDMLKSRQEEFYGRLVEALDAGERLDVDGNVSYLFLYAYDLIREGLESGFGRVRPQLQRLADRYEDEEKFARYCRTWALDCLLAEDRFEDWYGRTDPPSLQDGQGTHLHRYRLSLAAQTELEIDPLDLVLVRGAPQLTEPTEEHQTLFIEKFKEAYDDHVRDKGSILESAIEELEQGLGTTPKRLFSGYPGQKPKAEYAIYPFDRSETVKTAVPALVRDAENRVRQELDLPEIGKGWVQEAELYAAVEEAFPGARVLHRASPDWLGQQHFDVWIPEWGIALEFHGRQHFEPVDFFGGEEAFEKRKRLDQRKARLAERNDVELIIVTAEDEVEEIIGKVRRLKPDD